MNYTEWPLDDLLLCREQMGAILYHQLYSHKFEALPIITNEDAQLLIERGIKQVAGLKKLVPNYYRNDGCI